MRLPGPVVLDKTDTWIPKDSVGTAQPGDRTIVRSECNRCGQRANSMAKVSLYAQVGHIQYLCDRRVHLPLCKFTDMPFYRYSICHYNPQNTNVTVMWSRGPKCKPSSVVLLHTAIAE